MQQVQQIQLSQQLPQELPPKSAYPCFKEHYVKVKKLGEGSHGKVYLCRKVDPEEKKHATQNQNQNQLNNMKGSPVSTANSFQQQKWPFHRNLSALKKLKQAPKQSEHKQQDLQQNREIEIMRQMTHPNLMKCHQIMQNDKGYKVNHYIVTDYGLQLMQIAKHKEINLSNQQRRAIIIQLIRAMAELHEHGYIHRDVKPNNVFLMPDGTLKLGDFSISRKLPSGTSGQEGSGQEKALQMTGNVTTRYYRAPEIIYGSRQYGQEIDIWSLGCTLAELILYQPVFPGQTDIDQLHKIFSIVGFPQQSWPQANDLPYYFQFQEEKPQTLQVLLPDPDLELLDLIEKMLILNPSKRIGIKQALEHPYVKEHECNTEELAKICSYLFHKQLAKVDMK